MSMLKPSNIAGQFFPLEPKYRGLTSKGSCSVLMPCPTRDCDFPRLAFTVLVDKQKLSLWWRSVKCITGVFTATIRNPDPVFGGAFVYHRRFFKAVRSGPHRWVHTLAHAKLGTVPLSSRVPDVLSGACDLSGFMIERARGMPDMLRLKIGIENEIERVHDIELEFHTEDPDLDKQVDELFEEDEDAVSVCTEQDDEAEVKMAALAEVAVSAAENTQPKERGSGKRELEDDEEEQEQPKKKKQRKRAVPFSFIFEDCE